MAISAKLVAPEQKSVRAKLIRNVLFSGLRSVLLWPISFLLIPFILKEIGTGGYGTWAVFLTVINLTGLVDLGLAGTLTKQVSEHYATGDSASLNQVISSAIIIYASIGAVSISVLLASEGYLLPLLFQNTTASPRELLATWHVVLAVIGLNILTIPLYSVLTGLQRMDLTTIVAAISTLAMAGLTVILLWMGWGFRGLALTYLLACLINLIVFAWMVHRLLPRAVFKSFRLELSRIREILGFGLQLYVTQMAVTLQSQVEKLYLARLIGVVPVGWYNIAADVGQKTRRIPDLLLAPVMAAASELDARRDDRRLEELYHRLHKYLSFAVVPLTFYVALVAGRFVDLWLGVQLHVVAMPLIALVWVNFLNLSTGPGALILVGRGVLKPGVNATIVGMILIVSLSFILIDRFGFSGAVLGIVIAVAAATALFFYWFYRATGYSFRRLIREAYVKPAICSVAALVIVMAAAAPGRLGWAGLLIQAGVFSILYLSGLVVAGFFDRVDLAQLETLLPFARVVRKFVPSA